MCCLTSIPVHLLFFSKREDATVYVQGALRPESDEHALGLHARRGLQFQGLACRCGCFHTRGFGCLTFFVSRLYFCVGDGTRPDSAAGQQGSGKEKPRSSGAQSLRPSPPPTPWPGNKSRRQERSLSRPSRSTSRGQRDEGANATRDDRRGGLADMQTQRFEMLMSYFLQAVECLVPEGVEESPQSGRSFCGDNPPGVARSRVGSICSLVL